MRFHQQHQQRLQLPGRALLQIQRIMEGEKVGYD